MSQVRVYYPGTGTLSYGNAQSRHWVSSPRRYIDGRGYVATTSIPAWESVWIYCYPSSGLWLIISPD
jgi:hypothetical protein